MKNPPYSIETERGDVLGSGYQSLGHCQATASNWAIRASAGFAADLDGKQITALLVKDKDGKIINRVTKNFPAQ